MLLEAAGLTFTYPGAGEPAVRGLDFGIAEGEVLGFLGPNGSGKTTTQKLLTRILHGYEGRVEVFGRDLATQGSAYHDRIGVCFELPNLYGKLTAEENLRFYGDFFEGPTEEVEAVLQRLDLPVGDRRLVGQYSKGMKMRLVLARSLLNRPRLWFLDEPTTGQDPEHAVLIRGLIRERAAAGTSVFLTTHDMAVADDLCDRVAFIVQGALVTVDAPRRLKLAHAGRRVRVEYRDGDATRTAELGIGDAAGRRALARLVADHEIETLHTLEPSLESVFLKLTGRGLH
jgi:fluoroquinolone transport system ATP-binding protein